MKKGTVDQLKERVLRAVEILEKTLTELEPTDTIEIFIKRGENHSARLELNKACTFISVSFNRNISEKIR